MTIFDLVDDIMGMMLDHPILFILLCIVVSCITSFGVIGFIMILNQL